jgi:hypothetical protein
MGIGEERTEYQDLARSVVGLTTTRNQWKVRPADQQFCSLEKLYDTTTQVHRCSTEHNLVLSSVRVEAIDDDLQIVCRSGLRASLTHFAATQLCQRVGVPAAYLRSLSPTLAAQNINYGLKRLTGEHKWTALLYDDPCSAAVIVQSFDDGHVRVWDDALVRELLHVPAPWTSIVRDGPSPERVEGQTGLYRSWHDLFALMINPVVQLQVDPPRGHEILTLGLIVHNSSAVDGARLIPCWYEHVCSNHILLPWQHEHRIRPRRPLPSLSKAIQEAFTQAAGVDLDTVLRRITGMRAGLIAGDSPAVVATVFKAGIFSRRRAEEVYVMAETHASVHGDPRSAWGYAAGAMRLSQFLPYADERYQMDLAAARVLNSSPQLN